MPRTRWTSRTWRAPPARRTTLSLYALALALLALGVVVRIHRRNTAEDRRLDWLVLVVMPYDNDLDRCADPIMDALTRGVQRGDGRERVAVAVLTDRAATHRLTESLITRHRTERWTLEDDDSASARNVEQFVRRMTGRAPARRHIIVFLDHGGTVDQLGVDHHPSSREGERWLSASATAEALRRWKSASRADVPLLFLQQCGRGSIEVALAFRQVADGILASQTYVGSCNTYYEPLIAALRARPSLTTREIGETIMREDRDYTVYSLLSSRALDEWPARANALVSALRTANRPPSGALHTMNTTFVADGEESIDLVDAVQRLAATRGPSAQSAATSFNRWVSESLVLAQRRRGAAFRAQGWREWSGVSTVLPPTHAMSSARSLPGWSATRWIEFTELARSER
ncbi:MAG: clostripain-related cysteine peptidase [Polyangiales bacterium]